MLDDLFDYCFPILDKIGHKLDRIEDEMFEERAEDIVRDLSNAKQEIIAYRKIIKPERATIRVLERYTQRFLPEELDIYFDDIVDAAERIWDLLDNYKEVIEGLESTNESVISHRQNDVLRVLTIFSATMLPLSVVAGIFGMNLAFPGEGGETAFWIIVGSMIAIVVGWSASSAGATGCDHARRPRTAASSNRSAATRSASDSTPAGADRDDPSAFVTGYVGQNFGWLVENVDDFWSFFVLGVVAGCSSSRRCWRGSPPELDPTAGAGSTLVRPRAEPPRAARPRRRLAHIRHRCVTPRADFGVTLAREQGAGRDPQSDARAKN